MNEKTKARVQESLEAGVALDRIYEFTLILDVDEPTDEMANRLYESGCDDASLARQAGKTKLMFDRVATSYLEAVTSALYDVHMAGCRVIRVEADDLLTQADIARKTGRSRQMISLYISGKRGPGGFPAAESQKSGEHSLWQWSKVADWLARNDLVGDGMADEAAVAEKINLFLRYHERRQSEPELFDGLAVKIFNAKPASVVKSRQKKSLTPA